MKNPLISVPIKYGVIVSGLLMVLFLVLFYSGRHPMNISPFFDVRIIVFPLFLFLSIKEFRDLANNGVLHFWQGMIVGFVLLISIGLILSLFIILISYTDNSFLSIYITERIELLQTMVGQLTEQEKLSFVKEQLKILPLTTSIDLAIDYFLKTMGIGVFLNIIISIVLRKQSNLN